MENEEEREYNLARLRVFYKCCKFFGVQLKDFYIIVNGEEHYSNFHSFKIVWHTRPIAMAQKEEIINALDKWFEKIRTDVFRAMNEPLDYRSLKDEWTAIE